LFDLDGNYCKWVGLWAPIFFHNQIGTPRVDCQCGHHSIFKLWYEHFDAFYNAVNMITDYHVILLVLTGMDNGDKGSGVDMLV
jgi:hypothetical protein